MGAREQVRAVASQADTATTEAARREALVRVRERRTKLATLAAVAVAIALGVLAVVIAVTASGTRSEDVARRVAPEVAARVGQDVVADARDARIATGRRALAEANTRLVLRGLPTVPIPGPDATGDELLIQAARANVLADLPESTVADLRAQLGDVPTLPSSLRDPVAPPGDRVVTVLPPSGPVLPDPGPAGDGSGETGSEDGRQGGGSPQGGSGGGGASSPPAAPPPSTRRPLLPILPDVPLVPRLPLLGG